MITFHRQLQTLLLNLKRDTNFSNNYVKIHRKKKNNERRKQVVLSFLSKLVPYLELYSNFDVRFFYSNDSPITINIFFKSIYESFGDESLLDSYIDLLLKIKKAASTNTGIRASDFNIILGGFLIESDRQQVSSAIMDSHYDLHIYFWSVTDRSKRDIDLIRQNVEEDDLITIETYREFYLEYVHELEDYLKSNVPTLEDWFYEYYEDEDAFFHYLVGIIAEGENAYANAFSNEYPWHEQDQVIRNGKMLSNLFYAINIYKGKLTSDFIDVCRRVAYHVAYHLPTEEEQ